ncbi:hypothetical protein [Streptomyces zagrosensis]|uniref:Flp pilus assembly pilin Flp n=1 Tax=Streptomyces zagrosensis TaxID=1042984 RepID=A0A7W9QEN2_9ACTN|nr:hypothetical protein [Streptomyces zagrosensis]MBB5937642.1 Flp pilus assembly pilin Flp [Streptomyces zagrosensis]
MEPDSADDEPTWESLPPFGKCIVAIGATGLGLGVLLALIAVTLTGAVVVTFLSGGLIKADSLSSLFWAVGLCLPCGLLASVLALPLRLTLRLTSFSATFKLRAEAAFSVATTFLGVLFVESSTPGLHVEHPWLPALLAALLIALANLLINYFERRGSRHGSCTS